MPVRSTRPSKSIEFEATSVIERRGRWYIGYVLEVPGINVQERTLREVRNGIREQLQELAELAPDQLSQGSRHVERLTVRLKA